MYRLFILPLKSLPLKLGAFALAALFILAACGGAPISFDINLNGLDSKCVTNPFLKECDKHGDNIQTYRQLIVKDCTDNPSKSGTDLCIAAAEGATNTPSDDENGAEGAVAKVVDNTPKDIKIKPELNKNSLTKTDKEKGETTTLEIVDLCSDPATANNERCTPAVIDCINNPFSGSCEGDNLLGNFVRGGVTVSKTVILQTKRAVDCRDGNIDRTQCDTLNSEKARCAGTDVYDANCSAVVYSVCKANVFDPLCGDKLDVESVYFNERSDTCYEEPNNPNCIGTNGHIAVACDEYPFDRLCTGNTDYDDARANACESDPTVSLDCPVVPAAPVADVCLDNPFGPTCADSDYNNARKDLAKTCAIQAVTGVVTSACDTIIEQALPCVINPFDTACDSNPAVRTYIAQLRSTRVAFCKNSGRLFDRWIAPLCTGAPVAKSVCAIDPFNTVCLGDNDYADARLSACRDDSSNQHCSNIISGICGDNPFDALCGDGYANARLSAIRGICRNNPFDSLCGNGYANARLSACRDGTASTWQCRTTVAGICSGNPFDPLCGSGYTQIRRNACSIEPFTPRCAGDVYNDLRVTFCARNAGTHPSCPAPEPTTPQVTASVWADSFDEPLSHAASNDDTGDKFLIGGATNLDRGGVGLHYESEPEERTLTFANAIFNGAALGEDAADGVAFFHGYIRNDIGIYHNAYAGILSGTNLGAPLTNTEGSAKWFGVYKDGSWLIQKEFILNITFGGEDKAGSIEAIVAKHGAYDFFIKGDFDDAGVITGSVYVDFFRSNDLATRANIINNADTNDYNWKYKLTGLIGEEGAVGVTSNASGFVARPASVAELANLTQTCADDPFNRLCTVGYESERNAVVERCIADGTANDEAICGSAIAQSRCILHPFSNSCETKFNRYYEQAQANRLAFCGSLANVNDPLCTNKIAIINVCKEFPSNPHCSGNVYREARDYFCENSQNMIDPVCLYQRVTAEVWADSFDEDLAHGATADDTKSQFLIARETDLDTGGRSVLYNHSPNYFGNLNLADATFNGVALGGDRADGAAFFAAERANNGRYYSYAGILSGTNLGAPLTDTARFCQMDWVFPV